MATTIREHLAGPGEHSSCGALGIVGVRSRACRAVIALAVACTSTLAGAAPSAAEASVGECAWPTVSDANKSNVLYPDRNAAYWMTEHSLEPGAKLLVRGTYPAARYFSLVSYTSDGNPLTYSKQELNVIDWLHDSQIAPDSGSKNPFADPTAPRPPGGSYALVVDPAAARGAGSNTIAAALTPTAGASVALAYRVYVPTDAGDPKGSVPLPSLSKLSGGKESPIRPCLQPTAANLETFLLSQNRTALPPTQTAPSFKVGARPGMGANPDNSYLVATASWQRGRIVVVRGRAATFPDTRNGQRVTDPIQLRYWSMCSNEYRMPLPVTDCAADFETALDGDGYYTYVYSAPTDRPTNATRANGVTWLAWNPLADGALILRNMLPASTFHQAIQDAERLGDPATVMGPYYPRAVYCAKATFEAGGFRACFGS